MNPHGISGVVLIDPPSADTEIVELGIMQDGRVFGSVRHSPHINCKAIDSHEVNSCGVLKLKAPAEVLRALEAWRHGATSSQVQETFDRETRSGLAFESVECESSQDSA